ncbi:MAG: hypothetical protein ABH887_00665, partial [bacterium]
LYVELCREKSYMDDWDNECRFCLNVNCDNFGKAIITVYNPLTLIPTTRQVEKDDVSILKKTTYIIEG